MVETQIGIATPDDVERIKALAVAADMFTPDEAAFFDDMLAGFFDGSMEDHQWLVLEDVDGELRAAANYAPEPFSDRVWNLYFIAVDPKFQGSGFGAALMATAEEQLRARGDAQARVLIVETSSTDQYEGARNFYNKIGYTEEARIREFYGPGDNKVVFWKSLVT